MAEEKKVQFDEYQQKAITVLDNSVVSAGAGSGKTSVLAERFSYLVLEKNLGVDEILTLTFTKKATVEMYDRIYKTLYKKDPSKTENFYKANIKTLDSYCAYVARLGSHFYGLSPDFAVDNLRVNDEIKNLAVPFVLKHSDNEGIKKLADTKDFSEIAQSVFVEPILAKSTICEPIDFKSDLQAQTQTAFKQWMQYADEASGTQDSLTQAVMAFNGNRDTKGFKSVSSLVQNDLPEYPALYDESDAEKYSASIKEFNKSLIAYASCALPTAKGMDEIKDYLNYMRELCEKITPLSNFILSLGTAKKIIPLLDEFQTMCNDLKRTKKIITYADSASLAKCILRDRPQIRQLEKQKYRAIMIDEFQDNNSMQRDLLFMLAEKPERTQAGVPEVKDLCPDKLFFVGDEKQSIYRFRGADVTVFRGLSEDFKNGNLELNTNYRCSSAPELVASFNTVFGAAPYPPQNADSIPRPQIFFNEDDSLPKYEAVYHEALLSKTAKEITADYNSRRMHVALYKEKDDDSEADEANSSYSEAYWIAGKIKDLIENQGYKPGDIAILFKAYSIQPVLERMLRLKKIPYQTETQTGFFSDGPTNDIFAFLRLCAFPNDTLTFSKVLRSPFVNLSYEQAQAVLSATKTFSPLARDILTEDALSRYQNAHALYSQIQQDSKTLSLTHLITELWYTAGYRYETMWNMNVRMYDTLHDMIFELARKADEKNLSLAEFVDSVRFLEDDGKKLEDMDITIEREEGVHLLTIHKSKGLQYPVVFLCDISRKKKNESGKVPVVMSDTDGLCINFPGEITYKTSGKIKGSDSPFFVKAKELNSKMEEAELRRLLYVALTRAEKEVFITGKVPQKKSSANIYSLLEPLIEFYEEDSNKQISPFDTQEIPPLPQGALFAERETRDGFVSSAKKMLQQALTLTTEEVPPLHYSPSHLYSESKEDFNATPLPDAPMQEINKIVEETDGEFGFNDFGTIAHAYLEAAVKGCEVHVPEMCYNAIKNSEKHKKTIDQTCVKMQKDFLATPLAKEALVSDWKKTEYSFRSKINGKILSGQIDLVYKNKDGTYTIVDYKTNQSIEPEIYKLQLASYRACISQITGASEKNIKCVLYYLRFARQVDITELCDGVNLSGQF